MLSAWGLGNLNFFNSSLRKALLMLYLYVFIDIIFILIGPTQKRENRFSRLESVDFITVQGGMREGPMKIRETLFNIYDQ
jgi:hypothetical protein